MSSDEQPRGESASDEDDDLAAYATGRTIRVEFEFVIASGTDPEEAAEQAFDLLASDPIDSNPLVLGVDGWQVTDG